MVDRSVTAGEYIAHILVGNGEWAGGKFKTPSLYADRLPPLSTQSDNPVGVCGNSGGASFSWRRYSQRLCSPCRALNLSRDWAYEDSTYICDVVF